jgi:hypothetical protein
MELLKKLRLKTDTPLWLVNEPFDVMPLFEEFEIKKTVTGKVPVAQLMLFVYSSIELAEYIHKLTPYIAPDTLFWIMYPKATGSMKSDLTAMRSKGWDVLAASGFRGQTSVSLNDDWTGMRFTNAPEKKPSTFGIPPEERNDPGIDYVNRTVTLPLDALGALEQFKGLAELFHKQSFTNKKEAVLALNAAKKPETRAKRIEKLVEEMKGKMK